MIYVLLILVFLLFLEHVRYHKNQPNVPRAQTHPYIVPPILDVIFMSRPKRRRTRIDKSWFGTGYFFGRNVNRHIL